MDVFTAIPQTDPDGRAGDWITICALEYNRWEEIGIEVSGWELADGLAHLEGFARLDIR